MFFLHALNGAHIILDQTSGRGRYSRNGRRGARRRTRGPRCGRSGYFLRRRPARTEYPTSSCSCRPRCQKIRYSDYQILWLCHHKQLSFQLTIPSPNLITCHTLNCTTVHTYVGLSDSSTLLFPSLHAAHAGMAAHLASFRSSCMQVSGFCSSAGYHQNFVRWTGNRMAKIEFEVCPHSFH